MNQDHRFLPELGLLRAGLLLLALANLLPPLAELLFAASSRADAGGAWSVIGGIVAPVMAPILVVGLLFDYIMSRVRAADAEGAERERFVRIARIEIALIGTTLLIWIPFFSTRLG